MNMLKINNIINRHFDYIYSCLFSKEIMEIFLDLSGFEFVLPHYGPLFTAYSFVVTNSVLIANAGVWATFMSTFTRFKE